MTAFNFKCPACGAAAGSDRAPGGTTRTCERCGKPFVVKTDATARESGPASLLPSLDDARAALEAWQEKVWFVPERFAREAEISDVEPALTISVEIVLESRAWKETNGEPAPDPGTIQASAPGGDAPSEYRLPDSERRTPCAACSGVGKSDCGACA